MTVCLVWQNALSSYSAGCINSLNTVHRTPPQHRTPQHRAGCIQRCNYLGPAQSLKFLSSQYTSRLYLRNKIKPLVLANSFSVDGLFAQSTGDSRKEERSIRVISRGTRKKSRDKQHRDRVPRFPLILPNCIFKTRDTKNMKIQWR